MSLIAVAGLLSAVVALGILVYYLFTQPPLVVKTRLLLFLGLGALPTAAAVATTAYGMHETTEREFCGSCHVMGRHVADAEDPNSRSLASRHARSPFFGDRNCYLCHADYGMLGYPMTKLNGMRHVWEYYAGGFSQLSVEQALPKIHLYRPYQNQNCFQCHSGQVPSFTEVPDHVSLAAELSGNSVSCASAGCHGPAHPFSKPKLAKGEGDPVVPAGAGEP